MSDDGELGASGEQHDHEDVQYPDLDGPDSYYEPAVASAADDEGLGGSGEEGELWPDQVTDDRNYELPTTYDVAVDDVEIPSAIDDPFWTAAGYADVTATFDGTSVAELLGVLDEALTDDSSNVVDEFRAAVAATELGLDVLTTVDGYVTPRTLGEPE